MSDYPAPRYLRLRKPKTVEEMMPKARELVNQPPGQFFFALKPSYDVKPGDKILFVVLREYDPMVIEAVCRAMREMGARVDVLTLDAGQVGPPEELAAHEAISIGLEEEDYSYYYTMITDLIRIPTGQALVDLEKYDKIISGAAGPKPKVTFPWHRFSCVALADFAGPLIDTPSDLQRLINQKTWAQILSCASLRMTDPEGTDVQWTNYDDQRPYLEDHLLARPYNIGVGFGGKDDCAGVVAGTINHIGAFPHCKAYIEGGQVVNVEGGGRYGEVWREKLEAYRNLKLPPLPLRPYDPEGGPTFEIADPGFFVFWEAAIGTVPGVGRLPTEALHQHYSNFLHDRMRSGYIHNGFGPAGGWHKALIEAGLPWAHVHIHCMFPTLEGKTSSGEKVVIVNKGHLTSLDDPEVRSLASKYGNPDELLTEAWIPGVPGINVPGDYMKDYGQDPLSWLKKEAMEHPIWID